MNFFGRNSLIILCTHSALSTIGITRKIILKCNITNELINNIIIFIIILIIEYILVLFINRYAKFLIEVPSKHKFKSKE